MYFVGEKGVTKKQKGGGSLHFFFFLEGEKKEKDCINKHKNLRQIHKCQNCICRKQ